jgi:hypothetical protein
LNKKGLTSPETNQTMRRILPFLALLISAYGHSQACNPDGNIVVYTNYDGGILNINCDVNIPNLKIGICTYEWCQVNITGPFAGNVTQVVYAGFIGQNNHCGFGNQTTTVTGVPAGIVSILFAPPATQSDPNGNNSIICAYSCGPGNQGGCNTSTQVAAYFTTTMNGTLRSYETQYGCWTNTTKFVSQSGCCGAPPPPPPAVPTADFSVNDMTVCIGQCVNFADQSIGTVSNYAWTFPGSETPISTQQNPSGICYNQPGLYTATLTVSNANGSSSHSLSIQVFACGIPGCADPTAINFNPNALTDDGSCIFSPCDDETCLGDLNGDGIINFTDLSIFLSVFGSICP